MNVVQVGDLHMFKMIVLVAIVQHLLFSVLSLFLF